MDHFNLLNLVFNIQKNEGKLSNTFSLQSSVIALEIRDKIKQNTFLSTTIVEGLIPLGYIFSLKS